MTIKCLAQGYYIAPLVKFELRRWFDKNEQAGMETLLVSAFVIAIIYILYMYIHNLKRVKKSASEESIKNNIAWPKT